MTAGEKERTLYGSVFYSSRKSFLFRRRSLGVVSTYKINCKINRCGESWILIKLKEKDNKRAT